MLEPAWRARGERSRARSGRARRIRRAPAAATSSARSCEPLIAVLRFSVIQCPPFEDSVGPGGSSSGVDAFTGTLKRPTPFGVGLASGHRGLLSVGLAPAVAGRRRLAGDPPGLRVLTPFGPGRPAFDRLSGPSLVSQARSVRPRPSREGGLRAVPVEHNDRVAALGAVGHEPGVRGRELAADADLDHLVSLHVVVLVGTAVARVRGLVLRPAHPTPVDRGRLTHPAAWPAIDLARRPAIDHDHLRATADHPAAARPLEEHVPDRRDEQPHGDRDRQHRRGELSRTWAYATAISIVAAHPMGL